MCYYLHHVTSEYKYGDNIVLFIYLNIHYAFTCLFKGTVSQLIARILITVGGCSSLLESKKKTTKGVEVKQIKPNNKNTTLEKLSVKRIFDQCAEFYKFEQFHQFPMFTVRVRNQIIDP